MTYAKEIEEIKKLKEIKLDFREEDREDDHVYFHLNYITKLDKEYPNKSGYYCLYFNMYHNCFVILTHGNIKAFQLLKRWLTLQGINNKCEICIKMGKIKRDTGVKLSVEEYVQLLALLKLQGIKTWAQLNERKKTK